MCLVCGGYNVSIVFIPIASTKYTLYKPLHMQVSMLHLFVCLLKTVNEKSIMTIIILFCSTFHTTYLKPL